MAKVGIFFYICKKKVRILNNPHFLDTYLKLFYSAALYQRGSPTLSEIFRVKL